MDIDIRPKKKSKNYRMSPESIRLIAQLAKAKGTNVSEVLDALVVQFVPRILEGLERDTNQRRRTAE